jgi:hypothetical protein
VVVGVLAVGGTVALAGAMVAEEEGLAVLVVVVLGCTPADAGRGKLGVELV